MRLEFSAVRRGPPAVVPGECCHWDAACKRCRRALPLGWMAAAYSLHLDRQLPHFARLLMKHEEDRQLRACSVMGVLSAVVSRLVFSTSLKLLRFVKRDAHDASDATIASAIGAEGVKVKGICEELDMPIVAAAVGDGLKVNSSLTHLHFTGTSVGDVGGGGLGGGLKVNTLLTHLYLGRSDVGDAGAAGLAEGLKANCSLSILHLGSNKIGDVGASAVGDALNYNTALHTLYLRFNGIGNVGAVAIGQGLAGNNSLTHLDLAGNAIGDAGAAGLGDGLRVNTALNFLFLESNPIGATGARAISESLRSNALLALQELVVSFAIVKHPSLKAACASNGVELSYDEFCVAL